VRKRRLSLPNVSGHRLLHLHRLHIFQIPRLRTRPHSSQLGAKIPVCGARALRAASWPRNRVRGIDFVKLCQPLLQKGELLLRGQCLGFPAASYVNFRPGNDTSSLSAHLLTSRQQPRLLPPEIGCREAPSARHLSFDSSPIFQTYPLVH